MFSTFLSGNNLSGYSER